MAVKQNIAPRGTAGENYKEFQLTLDEFSHELTNRILELNGDTLRCIVCGNDGWHSQNGFVVDSFNSFDPPHQRILPVIILICDHCGYILQFAMGSYTEV